MNLIFLSLVARDGKSLAVREVKISLKVCATKTSFRSLSRPGTKETNNVQ